MVSIGSSLFAVHVCDVRAVICVEYDERADGPALKLVLFLVVSRIDIVTDTNTLVLCIRVRVDVTLIALLGLLNGLYDGRSFLS